MAGGKKKEPIVVAQIMGKWVGGGVEAVIMNYYRHIDRTKVQFDFICDEDSTNIPYDEIKKLGGNVIICPPYQKLHKYMKFLEKLFREKKYRIVHSNINTLSVFPLRAAKKAGVPVRIAHSHSTSNPKEWKKNLMKNTLRPFSKKYATDYFACSELAGRYLFGNKAFDTGIVKIIHNAIDVEKFKYDPIARNRLRKEIGLAQDDFVIGHIGRFVEQKNHRFLIDIFSEVKKKKKNAKLVLVGQGPLREEIEKKVKDLGLEKDVFFLGQRNDTNKLYSVFDVFCLPSLYEGLPVVGVEAQANGVPCIFSNQITKETIINKNAQVININNSASSITRVILAVKKRTLVLDDAIDINKTVNALSTHYGIKKSISDKEMISVLMGTYNPKNRDTFERAINSILNQTYPYFEFIICDDGSTNDCWKWLQEISKKDARIKLIRNKHNQGLAKTLNKCLESSKYDLIARMDDDDISHLDRFKKQINYLRNHPDVDLVSSNMNYVVDNGIYAKTNFSETLEAKHFLKNSPVMHPTILAYKTAFLSVGSYGESSNVERMEDYDLFMRMMINGAAIATYPDVLYDYYYDINAQKKRKSIRYRLNELRLRFLRFSSMGLMPKGMLYVLKPLIALMIPANIIYKIRQNKREVK